MFPMPYSFQEAFANSYLGELNMSQVVAFREQYMEASKVSDGRTIFKNVDFGVSYP